MNLDNPLVFIGAVIGGLAAGLAAVLFVLMASLAHMSFPAKQAAIEQLRIDAANTPCQAAEDVVGQVTVVNQQIMSARTWDNSIFGLGVPDGWRTVQPIPVPERC